MSNVRITEILIRLMKLFYMYMMEYHENLKILSNEVLNFLGIHYIKYGSLTCIIPLWYYNHLIANK